MKKRLIYLVCLMIAVVQIAITWNLNFAPREALAKPQSREALQRFDDGVVAYNGVKFKVSKALAAAVQAETWPESLASSVEAAPADTIYPSHSVFNLLQLTGAPKSFIKPEIRVYAVQDYKRVFAPDRKLANEVIATIERLRIVLRGRNPKFAGPIPLLPIPDGYLAFRSHVMFLRFGNGTGLVFVTQGQQDEMPVNNENLSYEFLGLTDDNRFLVTAEFPLAAPFLSYDRDSANYGGKVQECSCFEGPRYKRFQRQYRAYVIEIKTKLNQLSAEEFEPKLALYNQLLSSIEIR